MILYINLLLKLAFGLHFFVGNESCEVQDLCELPYLFCHENLSQIVTFHTEKSLCHTHFSSQKSTEDISE